MTKALEKAFRAASRLPERDQDALAAAILDELAADEALAEYRAGRTKPLDPDTL